MTLEKGMECGKKEPAEALFTIKFYDAENLFSIHISYGSKANSPFFFCVVSFMVVTVDKFHRMVSVFQPFC